jgi:hypothetical protein
MSDAAWMSASESRGYQGILHVMPVYSHPDPWWRHVVFHTRGAWLPGNQRGFRSFNHKTHSSGDYKQPPPHGEHAGLYAYSKMLCPNAVTIPASLRCVVGEAMKEELDKFDLRLLVMSVGAQHAHFLMELPNDEGEQWRILGRGKRAASHAVRERLAGSVWGRQGRIETIGNRRHHEHVYKRYIPEHKGEGAWVWRVKEGVLFDPAAR